MEQKSSGAPKSAERLTRIPQAAGAAAGAVTPALAVAVTAEVTGLAGGAAIMKTLAIAGATVGGGAIVGVLVLGVGAVAAGWGVARILGRGRDKTNSPMPPE